MIRHPVPPDQSKARPPRNGGRQSPRLRPRRPTGLLPSTDRLKGLPRDHLPRGRLPGTVPRTERHRPGHRRTGSSRTVRRTGSSRTRRSTGRRRMGSSHMDSRRMGRRMDSRRMDSRRMDSRRTGSRSPPAVAGGW